MDGVDRFGRWSLGKHALWVVGLGCVVNLGCVRRRLVVRTSPPGAVIAVDNQVIGASPAASTFTYYGTRDIRIEKEGFVTETVRHRMDPPWYQYPPLDFVTDTLWPWELRDERVVDVVLTPKPVESPEQTYERANQLRSQARQGVLPAAYVAPPAAPAVPIATPQPPTFQPLPADAPLPSGGVPFQYTPST